MVSAAGPWLTDADGNRYVDLISSWGPMILGHAHPAVVEAVREAAGRGLSFGAPTEAEVELAEAIVNSKNPLTSRVIVNRIWHHVFGRGIVASVDNFGVLGEEGRHGCTALFCRDRHRR